MAENKSFKVGDKVITNRGNRGTITAMNVNRAEVNFGSTSSIIHTTQLEHTTRIVLLTAHYLVAGVEHVNHFRYHKDMPIVRGMFAKINSVEADIIKAIRTKHECELSEITIKAIYIA